ncbi:hypothetical protein SBA7_910008 [Candidatus Sulfotelmatobacter sp. SbA7]|jgi:hypothetical protein|nr:hypothetical protein SBA7_910008 [Candidatus Sulfotelmatobacter sp. SbA7]
MEVRSRRNDLRRSEEWPETTGTVSSITWDSSLPREDVFYYFSCDKGYFSGRYWHWFELQKAREVRAGDQIMLRYCPQDPWDSVLLEFK